MALWEALRRRGWTQGQLARELGHKSGTINRIMHGDRLPNLKLALRIRDLVGIDPELWHKPLARPFILEVSSAGAPRAA